MTETEQVQNRRQRRLTESVGHQTTRRITFNLNNELICSLRSRVEKERENGIILPAKHEV